ncbi:hypothetical protein RRG08_001424 [Elysia crispata]|uniref:Uncharacterized protein n=1 Tax=Elysia crispata TaxID=231223 RepID=A0AAE0ZQR0_9GAST|nr:hypothetical protein RRG08_001424 [Elysia crispata]
MRIDQLEKHERITRIARTERDAEGWGGGGGGDISRPPLEISKVNKRHAFRCQSVQQKAVVLQGPVNIQPLRLAGSLINQLGNETVNTPADSQRKFR